MIGMLATVLNSIYDDLAASVGYTATVKLRTWYGGGWLYVPHPSRATETHDLATLIGMPALRALVRDFEADQHLWLPIGDEARYVRDHDIALRLAAGDTIPHVAEQFGLSERRVEQLREVMVQNGTLALAAGRRRPGRRGRPRPGRSPYGDGLKILGTGEVLAEPPPP